MLGKRKCKADSNTKCANNTDEELWKRLGKGQRGNTFYKLEMEKNTKPNIEMWIP